MCVCLHACVGARVRVWGWVCLYVGAFIEAVPHSGRRNTLGRHVTWVVASQSGECHEIYRVDAATEVGYSLHTGAGSWMAHFEASDRHVDSAEEF